MRTAIAIPLVCAIGLLLSTITDAQTSAVAAQAAVTASAKEPPAFRTRFDRKIVPGQPVLVCTRVDQGPVIDGEVDRDPVWPNCGRTHGAWTQIARHQESGRQTVVYSCYDRTNLYFAFVCEEPELQNVHMDGKLTQGGASVGPDDCVEVVIEIGGLQGNGEIYSFRANARTQTAGWGMTGIPREYHTPDWKSAGKFGPNRWMLEMAIPFAELKRRKEGRGMATPLRGDTIGVKLVRYGAAQEDSRNRLVSTWNTDIPYPMLYICGWNGLLCSDDANALRDGEFAMPARESPWTREGAEISQTVNVRSNSFYVLSVQSDGPVDLSTDGKNLDLKNGKVGVWTDARQTEMVVTLRTANPTAIRKVTMEYQPGEEPPGVYCLTGNYRHSDRNIQALLPDAPEGSYRYVRLDYRNKTVGEEHPDHRQRGLNGNVDLNSVMEDLGGTNGWIPFGKGSLTGKPDLVLWNYVALPEPLYSYGVCGHALEIDLGQEYYVRGLDVLWAGPYTENFEIWGKVKAEDEWTLLHMDYGPFVEPSKRPSERRGYESVRGLDSVVRYLRWRNPLEGRWSVCIDGIQEMWVWGEPKGEHTGMNRFKAWVSNQFVPPVKAVTAELDPDAIQIVPRPRKMEKEAGWFLIDGQTRIVTQDHPEAKRVAQQIREEIQGRWRISVPIGAESSDAASPENVIYVGIVREGEVAKRLAEQEALKIDLEKPQGYGLHATPKRVVVIGRDAEGLYYGVQSLMMAMRWRNLADDKGAVGVRCVKVLDWPGTLDRACQVVKPMMFSFPPSEIPRVKRICQLLSRYKLNAVFVSQKAADAPLKLWPPGAFQKFCQEVRQEYHVEVRPYLLLYAGGSYYELAHAQTNMTMV